MNITDTKINNGFWKERKELNKSVSLYAVLKSLFILSRVTLYFAIWSGVPLLKGTKNPPGPGLYSVPSIL